MLELLVVILLHKLKRIKITQQIDTSLKLNQSDNKS